MSVPPSPALIGGEEEGALQPNWSLSCPRVVQAREGSGAIYFVLVGVLVPWAWG